MIGKRKDHKNFYLPYIAIALTIFTIISYVYWTLPIEITAKIGSYTQNLTLIIFTITGLVTLQTFKQQNEDRARMAGVQHANLTQSKVADVDKIFMGNPFLDRLYFQMYFNDPTIKKIIKMRGPIKDSPEILKAEHQASNLIFQKMSDIYACESLDHNSTDCIEWINTFRGWMQSPILREHWKYLKYEQHPDVRSFVERQLIEKNKFINNSKVRSNVNYHI